MRCDAMRCDAMRCDAMRCDAMRCDAMRCDAMDGWMDGWMKYFLTLFEKSTIQTSARTGIAGLVLSGLVYDSAVYPELVHQSLTSWPLQFKLRASNMPYNYNLFSRHAPAIKLTVGTDGNGKCNLELDLVLYTIGTFCVVLIIYVVTRGWKGYTAPEEVDLGPVQMSERCALDEAIPRRRPFCTSKSPARTTQRPTSFTQMTLVVSTLWIIGCGREQLPFPSKLTGNLVSDLTVFSNGRPIM
ncbi:hypothetical protein MSG28_000403 [Choristoneura fumiferana]|uniref:Uncharacterized protein n=1 Tax=Choristoneura fumiferana TaxID=7141 RepID=A0ACC0K0I1_CHOFU|nr:hypothetical protein MSG28_000403 [Choristoneura fumiferana]